MILGAFTASPRGMMGTRNAPTAPIAVEMMDAMPTGIVHMTTARGQKLAAMATIAITAGQGA